MALGISPQNPGGEFDVSLEDSSGREVGFTLFDGERGFRERETSVPPPFQKIEQNSFHMGRGFETWLPNQFGFRNSRNAWTTTPYKAHGTIKPRWAKGIRSAVMNMPDSITFKPLIGSSRYMSASFSDATGFTMAYVILIIRKKVKSGLVGPPGNLKVWIKNDSSGDPGSTTHTSLVITSADVSGTESVYYLFDVANFALVGATTYHVVVSAESADTIDAHWEVACDMATAGDISADGTTWVENSAYSPAYRITDVDIERTWCKFNLDGTLYAVSKNDDASASLLYVNGMRGRATSATSTSLVDTGHGTFGASNIPASRFVGAKIRIIRGTGAGQVRTITANDATSFTVATWSVTPDSTSEYVVYSTDWWVEIASAFSVQVVSEPCVSMGIVYFPLGDGTQFRTMTLDYTDADDHVFDTQTTNRAAFFCRGMDPTIGPLLWRANNLTGTGSGGKTTVSAAPLRPGGSAVVYTTDLAFATALPADDNTWQITNLFLHGTQVYIMKEDSILQIVNNQIGKISIGIEASPSINNGVAALSYAGSLYVNFGHDVLLVVGGQTYSTGLHKESGIPASRAGVVRDLVTALGWMFGALDAGTGTSSIMLFAKDTQSWREHLRALLPGKRIRSLYWQPCPETRPRLWFEMGGDILSQEFPLDDIRPLNDTGVAIMHEFTIEMPTLDLLTSDPKFFSRVAALADGLAQTGDAEPGHELWVEYQMDKDIGSDYWTYAGLIARSPGGETEISKGEKRKIAIRFRGVTTEASDPVVLTNFSLTLFSRTTYHYRWSLYITISSAEDEEAKGKIEWLESVYNKAQALTMRSEFAPIHGKKVVFARKPIPFYEDVEEETLEASLALELEEVV